VTPQPPKKTKNTTQKTTQKTTTTTTTTLTAAASASFSKWRPSGSGWRRRIERFGNDPEIFSATARFAKIIHLGGEKKRREGEKKKWKKTQGAGCVGGGRGGEGTHVSGNPFKSNHLFASTGV